MKHNKKTLFTFDNVIKNPNQEFEAAWGAIHAAFGGTWSLDIWGLAQTTTRIVRFLQLRSSDHETRILPRDEICWAPKRRFRRRIAALDSRPAFQGRTLVPPS